jgi:maltose O-acetyltransferase
LSQQPFPLSQIESLSRLQVAEDARPSVGRTLRHTLALGRRAAERPGDAFRTALAIARGYSYKATARLFGRRFRAGPGLRIYGSLRVRGPGQVVFGDNVSVLGHATPWTYSDEARIVVGDRVLLGSARFGCIREITIGDDCIVADVSIADTDFHSTRADRRSEHAPVRIAPVHIARNVWLAQSATLLPGTVVGENSVVSSGAVCVRQYPANVIIMGNPAKVAAPIPGVQGE